MTDDTYAKILADAGTALFGPRWQTDIGRALGISDRTIRRYIAGTDDLPRGVYLDLLRLAMDRALELDDLVARLRQAATGDEGTDPATEVWYRGVSSRKASELMRLLNNDPNPLEACVAYLGEAHREQIAAMIQAKGKIGPDNNYNGEAHADFADIFRELCGYPEADLAEMHAMKAKGTPVDTIGWHFGWKAERVERFLAGERAAYFERQ